MGTAQGDPTPPQSHASGGPAFKTGRDSRRQDSPSSETATPIERALSRATPSSNMIHLLKTSQNIRGSSGPHTTADCCAEVKPAVCKILGPRLAAHCWAEFVATDLHKPQCAICMMTHQRPLQGKSEQLMCCTILNQQSAASSVAKNFLPPEIIQKRGDRHGCGSSINPGRGQQVHPRTTKRQRLSAAAKLIIFGGSLADLLQSVNFSMHAVHRQSRKPAPKRSRNLS